MSIYYLIKNAFLYGTLDVFLKKYENSQFSLLLGNSARTHSKRIYYSLTASEDPVGCFYCSLAASEGAIEHIYYLVVTNEHKVDEIR